MNTSPVSELLSRFFCVTPRSIYQASCMPPSESNLFGSSPVLLKVACRPGDIGATMDPSETDKPVRRSVPWYVRGKFHLAITPEGVQRYSITPHQRQATGHAPLPDIADVAADLRGLKTGPVVGLFLERAAADDCHLQSADAQPFDVRWYVQTEETLKAIGTDHTLISISLSTSKLLGLRFTQLSQKK